jgi:hypothetical protein
LATSETVEEFKEEINGTFLSKEHIYSSNLHSMVTTINYPKSWRSSVALYCVGISINADNANSVSFLSAAMLFDIISVKFTNCIRLRYLPCLCYSEPENAFEY